MTTLSQTMEFDTVICVDPAGEVTTMWGVYAPDLYHVEGEQHPNDVEVHGDDWTLLVGYTGQYGYNGAVMHSSEIISGRMESDILSHPGLYVACVVNCYSDDDNVDPEPAGWAIAYRPY